MWVYVTQLFDMKKKIKMKSSSVQSYVDKLQTGLLKKTH